MKKNKCKWFNGTMNATCEAGVKYHDVRVELAKGYALPCFNEEPAKCDKCTFPTDAELEAQDAEHKKQMADVMTARRAITEACGGVWRRGQPSVHGEISPCPACKKGTLRYSRAGSNGHVHAHCTTKECVSWME